MTTSSSRFSKMNVLAIGAASTALLWGAPALAQIQPSPTDGPIETQPAPPTQGFDDFPEDEVIATGIRASIARGIQVKRNADSIVDAISAEELGKFPDVNVAESLQRITGVAITRARGGEGQFVTVRGLGEEFNAVTYNNRLIATENAGREFSFDVIAAELINAAEVFKSPTAAQGDGSIGGRVNVRTAKPFDQIGFKAAASVGVQYEGLDDSFGPRFSGVVSNTFGDNDEFGVLASISYSERDIRTDVAESIFIATNESVLGDSIVPGGTPGATAGNRLNSFAASVSQAEQERLGGTLAFQWAPSDDTTVTLDGLYASLERPAEVFGYSYFPIGGGNNPLTDLNGDGDFTNDANGVVPGSVRVNDANQILAATSILPNAAELVGRRNAADTETFAIGLNVDHDFGDDMNFQGDISWSRADGVRDSTGSADASGAFYVLGWPDGRFSQNATGGLVPDITYTGANTIGGPQQELSQLTAEDVRLHFARNTSSFIEDEIFALRGDFTKALDDDSAIRVGLDYTTREKSNERFDNIATQCAFCGYSTSLADVASELVPGFFSVFDDDFLANSSANIPRSIPTFSIDTLEQAYVLASQRGFGPQGASALTPTFNPAASNVVEEDVFGGYIQADFGGELGSVPFTANAGVRVAYTDLTSTGAGAEIQSVTILDTNNQSFATTTSPRELDNDYFDVLPSFNINFDLQENLVARASFSRTLTRPTLTDLSTFFDVTSTNIGGEQIIAANPLLEAVRANNVDATLEWYGDGGISLTGAVFYKDISDFITNQNVRQDITIPQGFDASGPGAVIDQGQVTRSFLVSSPLNGDSAEVYGLELAGQYLLPNGFGVSGNITFAESSSTAGGISSDLENISDVSYNASVFYEGNGLQARAAVNHRGDYLFSTAGEGGLSEIVDDFTQVDLTVSYDVNETFTVFGEGQNVLNEQFFRFSETPDLLETFEDNGARWVAGVRASF